MKISKLIEKNIISLEQITGSSEIEIELLSQDSRDENLNKGLYFAVKGTQVDGHEFIADVIEKGSTVIVCSKLPKEINENVSYVLVDNVQKKMGEIASQFYTEPSKKIKIIAVTGTNGKTSIATFISQSLQNLNKKTLLLSTAGDYLDNQKITINRKASSSLENIELHKILREALDKGVEYCCLEATSIGLDQYRLAGLDIDVALFTNLADDHLDYHGTFNKYAEAKKKLFNDLKDSALALVNVDDEYGGYMIKDTQSLIKTVSEEKADYVFKLQEMNISGMNLSINDHVLRVPLVGKFNAYNTTMVYACLEFLKFNADDVEKALSGITGVSGRMEIVPNDKNILALVDYAHSSDALINVFHTLVSIPHKNIITVVGCGGDRDTTKRAPMAKVTQEMSTTAIYTADNPRTENLDNIFSDMRKGVNESIKNFYFIDNREEAIKKAIAVAREGDIVLVAGKGHENYQIIGTEKIHFDDKEVLLKYLTI